MDLSVGACLGGQAAGGRNSQSFGVRQRGHRVYNFQSGTHSQFVMDLRDICVTFRSSCLLFSSRLSQVARKLNVLVDK
jgi:hypothetical protein